MHDDLISRALSAIASPAPAVHCPAIRDLFEEVGTPLSKEIAERVIPALAELLERTTNPLITMEYFSRLGSQGVPHIAALLERTKDEERRLYYSLFLADFVPLDSYDFLLTEIAENRRGALASAGVLSKNPPPGFAEAVHKVLDTFLPQDPKTVALPYSSYEDCDIQIYLQALQDADCRLTDALRSKFMGPGFHEVTRRMAKSL